LRDEAVILAIGRRDPDVMNDVINKYTRLLWPIASAVLKNVGSEQDVEEIYHRYFIRFLTTGG